MTGGGGAVTGDMVVLHRAALILIIVVVGVHSTMENSCNSEFIAAALRGDSKCRPIQKVLKLPLPGNNSVTQMMPQFIEVSLCGGGCHNHRTSCVHTAAKMKRVPVILSKCGLSHNGKCHKECTSLEVEEHTACRCDCLAEQEDCRQPGHKFNRQTCTCECQDQAPAKQCRDQGRMWSSSTCTCTCSPAMVKACSTGFEFDHNSTCACVPKETLEGRQQEERVARSQQQERPTSDHKPKNAEVFIIVGLAGIATVFFLIILSLLRNIKHLRETVKGLSRRDILVRCNRYSDLLSAAPGGRPHGGPGAEPGGQGARGPGDQGAMEPVGQGTIRPGDQGELQPLHSPQ